MTDESPDLESPSGRLPSDRYLRRLVDWAHHRAALVRASFRSAVQVGVAAGAAWWLATALLPWEDPIYAPIGAVVAIGTGEDRLLGRPLRLLAGMVVAVAVAGVVVGSLGSGTGQIVLVTLITTVAGRFLFDDILARTYSAFHGAVIGALGTRGVIPEQLIEAAIGAVTGILIVHVLFPPRVEPTVLTPVEYAGYAARRSLRAVATSLRTGHRHEVRRAVEAALEVEAYLAPDDRRRTFGRQLVRLAPARWKERPRAEHLIEADRQLSSLLLDAAGLARLAERLTIREPDIHPEMAEVVEDFDVALGWILRRPFDDDLPDKIAESLRRLQSRLDSMEGMTRPQQMLCEDLRELSQDMEEVTEQLAGTED